MSLDQTDKKILNGLVEDGRMSYRELASRTDVTPPTVKKRVEEMVDMGVITGFTVRVDEGKLVDGGIVDAMVVLETDPGQAGEVFSAMKRCPGARYVMRTGDSKVLTHFKGPKEKFEEHVVEKMPEGVESYRTILVTDEDSRPPSV